MCSVHLNAHIICHIHFNALVVDIFIEISMPFHRFVQSAVENFQKYHWSVVVLTSNCIFYFVPLQNISSPLSYLMAYDEELANALGMEDRDAFAKFYGVLYDLVLSGDGDQCNAGNNNVNCDNNNNDEDANGEEQEEDMDQEEDDREGENEDE